MILLKPKVYKLKITLNNIEPAIWRRLEVPSDLFLHDFHKVIQTTMGWENSHLHHFIKGNKMLGILEFDAESNANFIDYTSVRLVDILVKENDSIQYLYDYGDDWLHEIILEEIGEGDEDDYYPKCIGGERNCPPENCGGVPGYNALLKIINHPGHPDHESMMDWLDEDWEPEYFDVELVNDMLMDDDFGCFPAMG